MSRTGNKKQRPPSNRRKVKSSHRWTNLPHKMKNPFGAVLPATMFQAQSTSW